MSEEDKKKQYSVFLRKLNEYGIETEELDKKYGELLRNASFTHTNEHGNAYEGSLLRIVMGTLTPYAIRIAEMLPDGIRPSRESVVKIALLHHIAKAVRLVPNDNQWEVEKRGFIFKYASDQPSIRTGLHSLMMSIECGIPMTAEEAEVMTVNDRELSDEQSRYHSSVLATVIRQANELTYMEINNKG